VTIEEYYDKYEGVAGLGLGLQKAPQRAPKKARPSLGNASVKLRKRVRGFI